MRAGGRAILRAALLLTALELVAGCRREARELRVPTAMTEAPVGEPMPTIFPGGGIADTVSTNPYVENAYAISEGKRLYSWYNCVGCHANGGGGIGPALMDSTWIYGAEPAQIFSTIVNGRPNGMPAWGGKIPAYQVWQLVAYVRSLSRLTPPGLVSGRGDEMHQTPPEQTAPVPRRPPRDTGSGGEGSGARP